MPKTSVYAAIIERIFLSKFKPGMREVDFEREEIVKFSRQLKISLPKNLGDLIYSFRYRQPLPVAIQSKAGPGEVWIIRGTGSAQYRFVLEIDLQLSPNEGLAITKVPDCTPGIITKYKLNDEQALLARVRYNRLVDMFSGVVCYSLQNHLRTFVPGLGQVETDEIYVGVDKKGAHYAFPIQAKGGKDKLSVVQIEQDILVCRHKFPNLICRPVAAHFMRDGVIALFELEESDQSVRVSSEKHYQLVPPDEVTQEDLAKYAGRKAD